MSSITHAESWRVTEAELAQYEQRNGHPMSDATRRHLEFLYYQAWLDTQKITPPQAGKWGVSQDENAPHHLDQEHTPLSKV